jgi:predicted MFS family arabinose efflux permease
MLPISLAGLLGDALLARFDFSALFGTALLLAALSLALSFGIREPRPLAASSEPSRGFLAALAQRNLLPLWWIGSVFSLGIAGIFTFTKTFVMETGIGSVGAFFSAYAGAALSVRLTAGWLPDQIGPERVLYPSLATLALGLLLLARADGTAHVIVAGLCCGAGHGFVFPILFGMVVTRCRDAERGSALAIFTALFDAGVLVGGPAFGALIRGFGYATSFAVAAVWIVLGSVVFALWERRR